MTGYESKRAAARDKLEDDDTQVYQDHDDALTIAYQRGYYDGKKAAAQEPTKYSFRAHWEEDGCIGVVAAIERLDGGVHLLKDIIDAPQQPWRESVSDYERGVIDGRQKQAQAKVEGPIHVVCQCDKCKVQPAQEPVAWLCNDGQNDMFGLPTADKACKACFPVYRQSPQRPWVGLTDDAEIFAISNTMPYADRFEFARAIEAKLKEKNT
jgi:hypothetical protein